LSSAPSTSEARRAADTEVHVSELMTPRNVNLLGKVFGGDVLAMIDKVAYVCAARFAGTVCVTASLDRVDFHSPIEVGELVHLTARVDYAGRTSIGIGIEVIAEDPQTGVQRHTNTSYVTMVALREGKPAPVPRLVCETDDEKRRFLMGRYRRMCRIAHGEQMQQFAAILDSADSAGLAALMEAESLPSCG
jgi:acyl-CoA hydrolase